MILIKFCVLFGSSPLLPFFPMPGAQAPSPGTYSWVFRAFASQLAHFCAAAKELVVVVVVDVVDVVVVLVLLVVILAATVVAAVAAAAVAGVIAEVSKRPSRERDTAQQTKFSRGTGDNSNKPWWVRAASDNSALLCMIGRCLTNGQKRVT